MNVDPIRAPDGVDAPIDTAPPSLPDPCVGNPCGADGSCFALNAQQTCLCTHGFVAVAQIRVDGQLGAVCRSPAENVPSDFYRRTLPEPRLPFPGKSARGTPGSDDGCSTSGSRNAPALWLLLAAPLLRRRRRA